MSSFTIPLQPYYSPADVAKLLGIEHSTVCRHARSRLRLAPDRDSSGWGYKWPLREMPAVLLSLLVLSPKARRNLRAQIADTARADAMIARELFDEIIAPLLPNPSPVAANTV